MLLSKYKIRLNQLYCRKKKNSGRNNTGRITVAHQGSGHKQQYRKIDFSGDFFEGTVINIEYDPNRTARIAKICTTINNKKKYFYIIAPKNIKIFDKVISTKYKNISANKQKYSGSFYFLKDLFTGDLVFNLEMYPMKGGQFVRTAGAFAKILQKSEEGVIVKLPSGEHRLFSEDCRACLGTVSNEDYFNEIVGKAGRSRWLNRRPTVRGVAMNPIDHPHGGNTSGGRHHKTPWARLTKGVPSRSLKKKNKNILKFYNKDKYEKKK